MTYLRTPWSPAIRLESSRACFKSYRSLREESISTCTTRPQPQLPCSRRSTHPLSRSATSRRPRRWLRLSIPQDSCRPCVAGHQCRWHGKAAGRVCQVHRPRRFDLAFVSLQERGKLAEEIENLQWPVYALDKTSGLKPAMVWRLARQLRKLRPSIVHTHNTAAFFYGVAAASLARVPRIIHTRHGQRFEASSRETLILELFPS